MPCHMYLSMCLASYRRVRKRRHPQHVLISYGCFSCLYPGVSVRQHSLADGARWPTGPSAKGSGWTATRRPTRPPREGGPVAAASFGASPDLVARVCATPQARALPRSVARSSEPVGPRSRRTRAVCRNLEGFHGTRTRYAEVSAPGHDDLHRTLAASGRPDDMAQIRAGP